MSNATLRPKQASQYLSISISTLWVYVKQGKLQPLKLSERVTVFRKSDLDAFIDSSMVA